MDICMRKKIENRMNNIKGDIENFHLPRIKPTVSSSERGFKPKFSNSSSLYIISCC
jgi:hypothetical protein